MNVTMGVDSAKEGSKPFAGFEPEMYSDEALIAKAQKLGIETLEVGEEGVKKLNEAGVPTEAKPAARGLLEARIRDFIVYKPLQGKRELVIGHPHDNLMDAMREITSRGGIWDSNCMPDSKPLWIESDSPGLAMLLSEHFATKTTNPDGSVTKVNCPVGRPEGWVPDYQG